jgi:hypothetical protein
VSLLSKPVSSLGRLAGTHDRHSDIIAFTVAGRDAQSFAPSMRWHVRHVFSQLESSNAGRHNRKI